MALSPEDVHYLRHWQVSIQCLLRDPDLDFVRCLRIISERIVPQLVPAINLEEHRKQTKFSACDEFASEIWAGYLESMIKRNDKELADIDRHRTTPADLPGTRQAAPQGTRRPRDWTWLGEHAVCQPTSFRHNYTWSQPGAPGYTYWPATPSQRRYAKGRRYQVPAV